MNKESISYIILVVSTFAVASMLTVVIRKILSIIIFKYAQKLKTNPTNYSFIKNSVGFIIYMSAIIFIFYKTPYLKSLGTGLFAGAGIVALVVGFAAQKAFLSIISGIFILISKPFKISDIIEFKDGKIGIVEEITLSHIVIKDYENRRIIIPNSVIIEETIINNAIIDEKIRKHVEFSISYDSNVDKAIGIIQDEAQKHSLFIDNRTALDKKNNEPAVIVRVIALSDFSVDLKAYVWTTCYDNAFILKCDLLKSVKYRFDNEGVEIPFPYRTLVYKNDLKNG
jgi:small-conductance mechanosensitive channel